MNYIIFIPTHLDTKTIHVYLKNKHKSLDLKFYITYTGDFTVIKFTTKDFDDKYIFENVLVDLRQTFETNKFIILKELEMM